MTAFFIFTGIIVLGIIGVILYKLYRVCLEHFFLEYAKWQVNQIPPNCLRLSVVNFLSGRAIMRFDHEYGYCLISWQPGESLSDVIRKITEEIKKIEENHEKKINVLTLNNTFVRLSELQII